MNANNSQLVDTLVYLWAESPEKVVVFGTTNLEVEAGFYRIWGGLDTPVMNRFGGNPDTNHYLMVGTPDKVGEGWVFYPLFHTEVVRLGEKSVKALCAEGFSADAAMRLQAAAEKAAERRRWDEATF